MGLDVENCDEKNGRCYCDKLAIFFIYYLPKLKFPNEGLFEFALREPKTSCRFKLCRLLRFILRVFPNESSPLLRLTPLNAPRLVIFIFLPLILSNS